MFKIAVSVPALKQLDDELENSIRYQKSWLSEEWFIYITPQSPFFLWCSTSNK